MKKETRVSAVISQSTRDLLERHVRATGVRKGHLVEQALTLETPSSILDKCLELANARYGDLLG